MSSLPSNRKAVITDSEARTRVAPGSNGWVFEVTASSAASPSTEDLSSGSNGEFYVFYSEQAVYFTMVSASDAPITTVTGSGPAQRASIPYKLSADTPEEFVIDPKRPYIRFYNSGSNTELFIQKSGIS